MAWIPDDDEDINDSLLPKLPKYGYCSDFSTLLQTLKLWRVTMNLFCANKNRPFPPIKRIIPAITSFYNHTKGEIDVTSHFARLANQPFHNLGPEAFLFEYLELLGFINAHHIFNWATIEQDIPTLTSNEKLVNKVSNNSNSTLSHFFGQCALVFRELYNGIATQVTADTQVTAAPQIIQKQKGRLFYNSDDGKAVRYNPALQHEQVKSDTRSRCAFCIVGRPSTICGTCGVHLCSYKKKDGSSPCFYLFHDQSLNLSCKKRKVSNSSSSSNHDELLSISDTES